MKVTAKGTVLVSVAGLCVYQLSAYAPELNPVEKVWSTMKGSLANLAIGTVVIHSRTFLVAPESHATLHRQPGLARRPLVDAGVIVPVVATIKNNPNPPMRTFLDIARHDAAFSPQRRRGTQG